MGLRSIERMEFDGVRFSMTVATESVRFSR